MLELTDTHCHVNLPEFDQDRSLVLERAREAGVKRLLLPGVDLASSKLAVELAEDHPGVYAAVGVHPHYAHSWNEECSRSLRSLAASPKVVAIGEIGLDYYRNFSPPDQQRAAFKAQLDLAAELELPVVVHQRNSMDDILDTLEAYSQRLPMGLVQRPGVLHAYSGDAQAASSALGKGFYLGVAGPVTFRNANDLRGVLAKVPQESLLIETDSPYMSPAPHRGKRNEPMYVRHIAERLALLFGLDMDHIAQVTSENANHLFRWCNEFADSNLS
jgi:TatD DNase family protein